ncbi:uncharacterized protein BKCO1_38000114 [Diplodia corticola]|uniref:Uncharacterized protein n=1 Tax=Diplodia corticola TaxID=236234 RepID=A0A1J9RX48_9PEZI|nr:uncharacterized protein BKCO1_38000114 [Diplodia corticola]OJD32412.1 hypothetical protein BKCO1_38000114 [Diplodia corticola]
MADGHDSGGHVADVSSHSPDHHRGHGHGHDDNPDHSLHQSGNFLPALNSPESNRRWSRNGNESDEEDGDAEEQPLLTRRSRRIYSPAPILAIVVLVLIVAVMGIVVVVSKSRDGYTGASSSSL